MDNREKLMALKAERTDFDTAVKKRLDEIVATATPVRNEISNKIIRLWLTMTLKDIIEIETGTTFGVLEALSLGPTLNKTLSDILTPDQVRRMEDPKNNPVDILTEVVKGSDKRREMFASALEKTAKAAKIAGGDVFSKSFKTADELREYLRTEVKLSAEEVDAVFKMSQGGT